MIRNISEQSYCTLQCGLCDIIVNITRPLLKSDPQNHPNFIDFRVKNETVCELTEVRERFLSEIESA